MVVGMLAVRISEIFQELDGTMLPQWSLDQHNREWVELTQHS